MNNIFDKFVKISSVAIEDEPEAHSVFFKVGVQRFRVSPRNCENKEHAEWFARMFKKALDNMLKELGSLDAPAAAEVNADGLLPCPFCGNPNPVIRSNGIGDLYVICDGDEDEMHCEASTSDRRCETREGAIRRWNTRAAGGGG